MSVNHQPYQGPERRRYIRIPFEAVLQYKVHKEGDHESLYRKTISKNISGRGILFKAKERFVPGTVLELEFTVPTEEGYSEVKILGKVVRVMEISKEHIYDHGVEFYRIKKKDEKAIANLVEFLKDTDEEV